MPAVVAHTRPIIKPRNANQYAYVDAIRTHDLVWGRGPAGTGKTFLAVTEAATALDTKQTEKIIVTRPIVTVANEKLGFTPGEIEDKNAPYFRPVRDVFDDVFGKREVEDLLRHGKIEASPMAYMGGWSVNAWILGDEMQNATYDQLYVLLTRGKEGSKFILNGDPLTQRYTNGLGPSGFNDMIEDLQDERGVAVVDFGVNDVVRSGFTQRVVRALEKKRAARDRAMIGGYK